MTTNVWPRLWGGLAGILGAAGVALGAYATHGLSGGAQDMGELASRYALYHAPALMAVALLERHPRRLLHLGGALLAFGAFCFSGSLTALALFDLVRAPLAPVGGTALILGWLVLAVAAVVGLFEE